MNEPETTNKQRIESRLPRDDESEGRMPFDTSDLRRIPAAADDDPPYRNWWVCED